MSGGTITGGRRGVALQNQDSFTMTGGKIIKCSIGVDIWEGSTAEISGGEISGHRSYGIHAVSGTVTMNGGVIKGNQNGIGIGERNISGTLNLSGGTITGNTHYGISYGNGVLNLSDAPADGATHPSVTENGDANVRILNGVNDLRINVTGPLSPSAILGISMAKPGVFTDGLNNRGTSANFSSDDAPHYAVRLTAAGEAELGRAVASITSGGVTNRYARLQDAMDAAQPNDTILLLDNISASTDTFPILAWQEDITLDLNGKTISGSPASSSGDLIQIYRKNVGGENSYGRLTLKDTAGSGEIICEAGGCENVINIRGGDPNVLTMYGGKISGGATNVRVNGYFNMHGGEISGGTTNVNSSGQFAMYGGEISGGTTNVNSLGQFTMSGGKISGGTTGVICHTLCSMSGGEISGASGNGVTLDDTSVFNLLGGTISGNGQYAIEAFENSFVFISNGNPIIVSRGSAESSRGIYLHEGSGISIYETPAAGSSIGVTLESGAGVAARGSRSKAPTEDDLAVEARPAVRTQGVTPTRASEGKKVVAPEVAEAVLGSGLIQPVVQPSQVTVVSSVESAGAATARTEMLVDVVESITDAMLVSPGLMRGQGEVMIRLKPEVLDGTEIHLVAEGRHMSIAFQPATSEAQQILEQNIGQFEQHLAGRIHNYQIAVAVRKGTKENERI